MFQCNAQIILFAPHLAGHGIDDDFLHHHEKALVLIKRLELLKSQDNRRGNSAVFLPVIHGLLACFLDNSRQTINVIERWEADADCAKNLDATHFNDIMLTLAANIKAMGLCHAGEFAEAHDVLFKSRHILQRKPGTCLCG